MSTRKLRPFLGVDGEGGGRNRHGQQHYLLLGAGQGIAPLYTGKHLTTIECLEWICDLPPEPLLVGFSFGYDASQILRDLDPARIARLFADKPMGEGKSRYTYWGDYGIEYLPKNYLRVCRLRTRLLPTGPNSKLVEHTTREPNSARTIYETFGFFQSSFLKALQLFNIGAEHWQRIEKNKAERAGFTVITDEIAEYNRLECELLAELMESFRATCHAADIRPKTWNGAGKIASAEHAAHGTITAEAIAGLIPDGVLQMAADAYYGGRFEVTHVGEVAGPIYEYDIGSAYPAAMRRLPCLLHGTWQPFTGKPPPRSIHVAYVAFDHPADAPLCSLPIRKKDGRLFWPRKGQGIYWSYELHSARRLGARLTYTAGWAYVRNCQCRPFAWIKQRYKQRLALGKDARGYPLKLGLASLYGKLAQRIGAPRWGNLIWAGQITAITRAWLNDAARAAPADVLMFATDAVFSRAPLPLRLGSGLGQWEASEHARLFIVQPGIYWGAKRPKTRGIPVSLFADHTKDFEQAWRLWCSTVGRVGAGPPQCGFAVPLFTGLRLAHARGKPETVGKWLTVPDACQQACQRRHGWHCQACRQWSFDWSRKRAPEPHWIAPNCVRTDPASGAADLVSVPHRANTASYLLDLERLQFDEQQEPVDLSPP